MLFGQTEGGALMLVAGGMQTALNGGEKGEVPSPIDGAVAQEPVYDVAVATIGSPPTTGAPAMVIVVLRLLPAKHWLPRKVLPWPEGSALKSSTTRLCVAATELESTLKPTVSVDPLIAAVEMIGEFCRLFAPVSPSPESLGGAASRVMPVPFAVMELCRIALETAGARICTPLLVLLAMRFAAEGEVPPIIVCDVTPSSLMPMPLGMAEVPLESVPMRLPLMVLPEVGVLLEVR